MNQVWYVHSIEILFTVEKPIYHWKIKTHLHGTNIKEDDEISLLEVKKINGTFLGFG